MNYDGSWGYGFNPVWGFIGTIFSIIITIIVIVLIIKAVKAIFGGRVRGDWHHWRDRMGGGALEMLRERYAKGEIDQEEFEARKKVLME